MQGLGESVEHLTVSEGGRNVDIGNIEVTTTLPGEDARRSLVALGLDVLVQPGCRNLNSGTADAAGAIQIGVAESAKAGWPVVVLPIDRRLERNVQAASGK